MKLPLTCPMYIVGDAIPRMIGSESKQPPIGVRRSATRPFAHKVCRCCSTADRDGNAKQKGYDQYWNKNDGLFHSRNPLITIWQSAEEHGRASTAISRRTVPPTAGCCGKQAAL